MEKKRAAKPLQGKVLQTISNGPLCIQVHRNPEKLAGSKTIGRIHTCWSNLTVPNAALFLKPR
jgi:hypothetical protein